ncbi:MAG: ATP-binding cassette domain-containing protein [Bacteroidaceae bacterium]|nr:ATP-binding cassette domain-containing protein [Bacteroidaceae bacterium]
MNDIILSSLLNLFALFGTQNKINRKASEKNLSDYLLLHFGVRDLESSLAFYNDLWDFYEEMPDLDLNKSIENICNRLTGKISEEEQALMLLRFMEFCSVDGYKSSFDETFKIVAECFHIDDSLFADFVSFVAEVNDSECVISIPYGGGNGALKAMYISKYNVLLFVYAGSESVRMNDVPVRPGAFQVWQRSGVLKSQHDKTLYYFDVLGHFRNDIKTVSQKIKLRGNHIEFRFDDGSDNGMHDFTFNLYNGELVAIMGGSGVGKSTLLSLLNGTLRPQQGSISINGHDISKPEAKALIGYVPQDDLLIEELTVYQNLYFTAKLCFDGMTEEELERRVMNILRDLGLEAARDLKVGSPVNKYISGGQRKRLNIALELIREPAILFLDEPTSGLSSADTEMVVNLLKEQAFKGKLIVANIHQPSSDVFKLFDRLWLLDKGGYPIYDGNPIEAVTYFKQAANYADSDISTCPTCGNVNPEIILNIIDEKSLSDTGQITNKRKKTPQEWHELYLKTAPKAKTKVEDLPETDQHRPSALKQTAVFILRNFKAKITNLQYILITLLEAPVLALICSLLTRYAPLEGYSIMNNSNLVSYYFMAVIVAIFLGMSGSAEEIIKDRALLKREKFLSLSYKSYIWSKILFMAGVTLVQTLLFIAVGNLIMGIHDLFWTWWLILFVSAFLASLTGLLLSQCLNSVVAIYITIPILLIPQILLCGLVVKFSDLTPRSTTGNVPIIGDVIPSRWAFEALAVTSFTDNDYEINFFEADREKYSTQYYANAYLHEMNSQLETRRSKMERNVQDAGDAMTAEEHLDVIKNSLPILADVCDLEPYSGDYSYKSLKDYFDSAENVLNKRSNEATLFVDRQVTDMMRALGKDEVKNLKRGHYNLQLETLVINSSAEQLCKVVDGHIVPDAGFAYLVPLSHNGRAPFYSSVKVLGNMQIKTLWYNVAVLLFMCLCVTICLLYDFPGQKIRKEKR